MGIRREFDVEKALEVLLYVTGKLSDTYNALKVLYFADRDHLERYGRTIFGDSYVAMKAGPVPSGMYDVVKHVRGDGFCRTSIPLEEAFQVDGYDILPTRDPDIDMLSDSDVECLDRAIAEYGELSFGRLKELSHDEAYQMADENDFISMEAIVRSLPDGELLLQHIRDC